MTYRSGEYKVVRPTGESATARPPIILAIDSQEWTLRSYESVIGPRGYAVTRAYTGQQGLNLLAAIRPDAILVGTHMADMSVAAFLDAVKEAAGWTPTLPIIVTTSGNDGHGYRADVLRRGAWTVISPPVDGEAFSAQLDVFVRAKMEADRIRDAALVDEQTGFYSLLGLARRARELAADAYRRSAPLACIVVSAESGDGRPADVASLELAEALRRTSRSSDLVGRVGSSQFAIVATADSRFSAEGVLARLRHALRDVRAPGAEGEYPLQAGIAQVANFRESALPVDDLLKRATQSLHTQLLHPAHLPS